MQRAVIVVSPIISLYDLHGALSFITIPTKMQSTRLTMMTKTVTPLTAATPEPKMKGIQFFHQTLHLEYMRQEALMLTICYDE